MMHWFQVGAGPGAVLPPPGGLGCGPWVVIGALVLVAGIVVMGL